VDPLAAVAALPLDAEICGCNGVSKGTILEAIENGADSLDAVKALTKASTSCGTCAGLTAQVVQIGLGDDFVLPEAETMCKCTDYSHDDVRKLILSKELKSIPEVMQELQWKTSCGCPTCRPALNYYLVCAWPGEYVDDGQSRFINERVHANIQKDGTYSVVPRMWGAWSPHKFKLAVSGCPRNCAEATCKDLGIVCVDSGYQVLVGGAAGMDVKETELLAQVATGNCPVPSIRCIAKGRNICTVRTNGLPRSV